jgi:hypothetical protein
MTREKEYIAELAADLNISTDILERVFYIGFDKGYKDGYKSGKEDNTSAE